MSIEDIVRLRDVVHVADIGAAYISEEPPYKPLIDRGLARLSAFDADPRHKEKLVKMYGDRAEVYTDVIADGEWHTLHIASPASGMTSLLKPSKKGLAFFNEFTRFGHVEKEELLASKRLDDIKGLKAIDYLKMDIQGGELMVLRNATRVLRTCVAIQLEVSFMPLYEGQPTFGEIDVWMRQNGFAPHCFVSVKKWSITPTIRGGNFRKGFNQLMEADIVYVKDPLRLEALADDEIGKLAYVAWYAYRSPDLAVYLIHELERRKTVPKGSGTKLIAGLKGKDVGK